MTHRCYDDTGSGEDRSRGLPHGAIRERAAARRPYAENPGDAFGRQCGGRHFWRLGDGADGSCLRHPRRRARQGPRGDGGGEGDVVRQADEDRRHAVHLHPCRTCRPHVDDAQGRGLGATLSLRPDGEGHPSRFRHGCAGRRRQAEGGAGGSLTSQIPSFDIAGTARDLGDRFCVKPFTVPFAHFRDHVRQGMGEDNASTIAERRIGGRACSLVLPVGRNRLYRG
ncbi:hypothetical protein MESS2_790063 [Mesorhizobium metallidurans STM 2683]|uniref:Uncharacterized protein n=1 Tax=Mesorhizobium metallidurans STM 2683 TaxID=1297569 RepID=M5FA33_9HYPH|nr:hypothetical protein MESS2_790063 [Mesorhizobium metallidurans STM 2683]